MAKYLYPEDKYLEQDRISRELVQATIEAKTNAFRKKRAKQIFDEYCSDLAVWARSLKDAVKETGLVGIHPFMLADTYTDRRDKVAAALLSVVINSRTDSHTVKRVNELRSFIGDSPYGFVMGAYKVKNYDLLSLNNDWGKSNLQLWATILNKSFTANEDMLFNNIDYYLKVDEYNINPKFNSNLEETKFWVSDRYLDIPKREIKVPLVSAVKKLLHAWVPRLDLTDMPTAAGFFGFEYPAEIWYAAMGRLWLYTNHYDDIKRLEQNLHCSYSDSNEFLKKGANTELLKNLQADVEEMRHLED